MANTYKRLRIDSTLTERLLDHMVDGIVEHLHAKGNADITVVNETLEIECEFLQQQLDSAIAFTLTATRVADSHWRFINWLEEQLAAVNGD